MKRHNSVEKYIACTRHAVRCCLRETEEREREWERSCICMCMYVCAMWQRKIYRIFFIFLTRSRHLPRNCSPKSPRCCCYELCKDFAKLRHEVYYIIRVLRSFCNHRCNREGHALRLVCFYDKLVRICPSWYKMLGYMSENSNDPSMKFIPPVRNRAHNRHDRERRKYM